ncbi:fatty acid desaturase family protein [Nocardia carnea]|uniref:Fatty acid desaturase family protein n=1 Tax=Nocardia carnea TaxID=37328 RepID=A0ABW7TLR5_9NOCA|nr:fatty acid desaturase [Nocardia carnea]
MAITEVGVYAHLSPADVEAFGNELDAIRRDIVDQRGARDAAYIRRTIAFQRGLDVVSRLIIALSRGKTGWLLGAGGLAVAKSVENMELGHNIGHGQWDWMNDPEIHSRNWEWDMAGVSAQWRYAHNFRHHVYTNVLGMDDDIGFGVMRVTRDQPWRPRLLLQPLQNLLLAATFEWGIALHDLDSERDRAATPAKKDAQTKAFVQKIGRQAGKDFLLFPVLSGRRWRRTLTSKPEWYLRQMLGTANFDAGPLPAFSSGNLCYQIEHHLFPDLPSNRYAEMSHRVRALCEKYDLPYTTGPLWRQYLLTLRTIHKLALPDSFLTATSDDAPETASERKFLGRNESEGDHADSSDRAVSADRTGLRSTLHAIAARPARVRPSAGTRHRAHRRHRRMALQR